MYEYDLEKAKDFFIKYFNAVPNQRYHNKTTGFYSYFFYFKQGSRLEFMCKPSMSDDEKHLARTGYIHIAFRLGSSEALDNLTGRLQADGYYESSIIGIEDNQIEITV